MRPGMQRGSGTSDEVRRLPWERHGATGSGSTSTGRRAGRMFDVIPLGTLASVPPGLILSRIHRRAWSSRTSVMVTCELQRRSWSSHPGPAREITFVHPGAFPALPAALPDARGEDALTLAALERTRLAGAGRLAVAYEHGQLAAVHFIHTHEHEAALERVSPGLYPPLDRDAALTESLFVFPAFRCRGVATALLRASAAELARRGFRHAMAVIDVNNRGSLRAFDAAGFTPSGMVRVDSYRLGSRSSRVVPLDAETARRYRHAVAREPRAA